MPKGKNRPPRGRDDVVIDTSNLGKDDDSDSEDVNSTPPPALPTAEQLAALSATSSTKSKAEPAAASSSTSTSSTESKTETQTKPTTDEDKVELAKQKQIRCVTEFYDTQNKFHKDMEDFVIDFCGNLEDPVNDATYGTYRAQLEEFLKPYRALAKLKPFGTQPSNTTDAINNITKTMNSDLHRQMIAQMEIAVINYYKFLQFCETKKIGEETIAALYSRITPRRGTEIISIGSYGLKPFQRLGKYSLLLRDLGEYTSKISSSAESNTILDALSNASDIAKNNMEQIQPKMSGQAEAEYMKFQTLQKMVPHLNNYIKTTGHKGRKKIALDLKNRIERGETSNNIYEFIQKAKNDEIVTSSKHKQFFNLLELIEKIVAEKPDIKAVNELVDAFVIVDDNESVESDSNAASSAPSTSSASSTAATSSDATANVQYGKLPSAPVPADQAASSSLQKTSKTDDAAFNRTNDPMLLKNFQNVRSDVRNQNIAETILKSAKPGTYIIRQDETGVPSRWVFSINVDGKAMRHIPLTVKETSTGMTFGYMPNRDDDEFEPLSQLIERYTPIRLSTGKMESKEATIEVRETKKPEMHDASLITKSPKIDKSRDASPTDKLAASTSQTSSASATSATSSSTTTNLPADAQAAKQKAEEDADKMKRINIEVNKAISSATSLHDKINAIKIYSHQAEKAGFKITLGTNSAISLAQAVIAEAVRNASKDKKRPQEIIKDILVANPALLAVASSVWSEIKKFNDNDDDDQRNKRAFAKGLIDAAIEVSENNLNNNTKVDPHLIEGLYADPDISEYITGDRQERLESTYKNVIRKMAQDLTSVSREAFLKLSNFPEVKNNHESYTKLTNCFNNLMQHVATDILQAKSIDERTLALERWIAIQEKCLKEGDFNTFSIISSAISSSSIGRLKATFEGLSDEAKALRKKHEVYFTSRLRTPEPHRNDCRDAFESGRPVIPYYGSFRTEFNNIGEVPDKGDRIARAEPLIELLQGMQKQNAQLADTNIPSYISYEDLSKPSIDRDNELYDSSLKLEARGVDNKQSDIFNDLTESPAMDAFATKKAKREEQSVLLQDNPAIQSILKELNSYTSGFRKKITRDNILVERIARAKKILEMMLDGSTTKGALLAQIEEYLDPKNPVNQHIGKSEEGDTKLVAIFKKIEAELKNIKRSQDAEINANYQAAKSALSNYSDNVKLKITNQDDAKKELADKAPGTIIIHTDSDGYALSYKTNDGAVKHVHLSMDSEDPSKTTRLFGATLLDPTSPTQTRFVPIDELFARITASPTSEQIQQPIPVDLPLTAAASATSSASATDTTIDKPTKKVASRAKPTASHAAESVSDLNFQLEKIRIEINAFCKKYNLSSDPVGIVKHQWGKELADLLNGTKDSKQKIAGINDIIEKAEPHLTAVADDNKFTERLARVEEKFRGGPRELELIPFAKSAIIVLQKLEAAIEKNTASADARVAQDKESKLAEEKEKEKQDALNKLKVASDEPTDNRSKDAVSTSSSSAAATSGLTSTVAGSPPSPASVAKPAVSQPAKVADSDKRASGSMAASASSSTAPVISAAPPIAAPAVAAKSSDEPTSWLQRLFNTVTGRTEKTATSSEKKPETVIEMDDMTSSNARPPRTESTNAMSSASSSAKTSAVTTTAEEAEIEFNSLQKNNKYKNHFANSHDEAVKLNKEKNSAYVIYRDVNRPGEYSALVFFDPKNPTKYPVVMNNDTKKFNVIVSKNNRQPLENFHDSTIAQISLEETDRRKRRQTLQIEPPIASASNVSSTTTSTPSKATSASASSTAKTSPAKKPAPSAVDPLVNAGEMDAPFTDRDVKKGFSFLGDSEEKFDYPSSDKNLEGRTWDSDDDELVDYAIDNNSEDTDDTQSTQPDEAPVTNGANNLSDHSDADAKTAEADANQLRRSRAPSDPAIVGAPAAASPPPLRRTLSEGDRILQVAAPIVLPKTDLKSGSKLPIKLDVDSKVPVIAVAPIAGSDAEPKANPFQVLYQGLRNIPDAVRNGWRKIRGRKDDAAEASEESEGNESVSSRRSSARIVAGMNSASRNSLSSSGSASSSWTSDEPLDSPPPSPRKSSLAGASDKAEDDDSQDQSQSSIVASETGDDNDDTSSTISSEKPDDDFDSDWQDDELDEMTKRASPPPPPPLRTAASAPSTPAAPLTASLDPHLSAAKSAQKQQTNAIEEQIKQLQKELAAAETDPARAGDIPNLNAKIDELREQKTLAEKPIKPIRDPLPPLGSKREIKRIKDAVSNQDINRYMELIDHYNLKAHTEATTKIEMEQVYQACQELERTLKTFVKPPLDPKMENKTNLANECLKQLNIVMGDINLANAIPGANRIAYFSHEAKIATGRTPEELSQDISAKIEELTKSVLGDKSSSTTALTLGPTGSARIKTTDRFLNDTSARVSVTKIQRGMFQTTASKTDVAVSVQHYDSKSENFSSTLYLKTGFRSRLSADSSLLVAINFVEDYIRAATQPMDRLQLTGSAGKNKEVIQYVITYVALMHELDPNKYPSGVDNNTVGKRAMFGGKKDSQVPTPPEIEKIKGDIALLLNNKDLDLRGKNSFLDNKHLDKLEEAVAPKTGAPPKPIAPIRGAGG